MHTAQNVMGLRPTQEPAVIEPGTLIVGVSKEGILHQLQLFQQYIFREPTLWARVWLGVQLGQEAGAIMPGGIVGEVTGDEAVSEG